MLASIEIQRRGSIIERKMNFDAIQEAEQELPARGAERPDRKAVRRSIDITARLSSPFIVMNTLATIVAAYGLLADSTAVVIGAMIIAMLLGPIMGLALALVDGDAGLLKRALVAEFAGAALVLTIGFLIGKVHSNLPITAEILARTKPNLLDLIIALAGGAAGAYASASPRVSVGLVGVAISTALVPPLTACGICLSRGLTEQASGAFILFFTNLVAIQCASSVVLVSFGFHKVADRQTGDRAFIRRLVLDVALFFGLSIFLYTQLTSTVRQQQFEEAIKQGIRKGLASIPGAYLSEARFREVGAKDVVVAVVTVPSSITPAQTAEIQSLLPSRKDHQLELHVRSLITKETTAEGYQHELTPTAPPVEQVDPEEPRTTHSDSLTEGSDAPGDQNLEANPAGITHL